MIIHAYTLYDRKALQYHQPFFAVSDGAAVRMLQDLVADSNTLPGRHPGDFVLYRCGAYDDSNGSLLPVSTLGHIIDASAVAPRATPLPFDPEPGAATRAAGIAEVPADQAEVKFNGSGV